MKNINKEDVSVTQPKQRQQHQQRSDSHRIQNSPNNGDNIQSNINNSSSSNGSNALTGNGPRVSFNRDVHVKRIGSRPTDQTLQQQNNSASALTASISLRRELPSDLSEEALRKEAALVLKQTERIKCRANGGSSDIVGVRDNEKLRVKVERKPLEKQFNSLPTRGKKKAKPVSRSVSDASAKKPKKPSIFSLFSRKSDQHLDKTDDRSSSDNTNITSKKVSRSKSDVGSTKESHERRTRRKSASENEDSATTLIKKKAQLSPIIEASPRDDYFIGQLSPPLKETDKKRKEFAFYNENTGLADKRKLNNTNDCEIISKTSKQTIIDGKISGNIGYTSHEDLDLIPSKPIADSIQGAISNLSSNKYSKSLEEMHSSQMPPEKPRLTKGITVDGLVKRLSMERFSPPPHEQAFSYTKRPKDQIIYAQVVCNNDGEKYNKQTVHHQFDSNLKGNNSSHTNQVTVNGKVMYKGSAPQDVIDGVSKGYHRNKFSSRFHKDYNSFGNGRDIRANSDEDEGLGIETKKEFIPNQNHRHSPKFLNSEDEYKSFIDDAPIMPNFRDVAPDKYHLGDLNYRGRGDGREYFPEFHDLAQRRQILESRIKSRIGSRELLDEAQQEKEWLKKTKRDIYREPARIEQIRRTLSKEFLGTPEPARRMKSMSPEHGFSKYHNHNDVEIFEKYSPDCSHLEIVAPIPEIRTSKTTKYIQEQRYFDEEGEGFREVYRKETVIGKDGRPQTREFRTKRLSSPDNKRGKDIDTGYVNEVPKPPYITTNSSHMELDSSYYPNKYHHEHENRRNFERILDASPENTLQRQKKHQRSFDKGDSGIENDYRKDSFNNDLKFRKRRTIEEDIVASQNFLKRESAHTQETHPLHFINHFIYTNRERSIDDGSRYDPRLDKYLLVDSSTLNRGRSRSQAINNTNSRSGTLKSERKISGLEKVKQLFTGSMKKNKSKKEDKPHDQEVRTRYREYRGSTSDLQDSSNHDISSRRRLSTPKSSPIVTAKRAQSFLNRSSKSSATSSFQQQENRNNQKLGWFKSLDRLATRKKNPDVRTEQLAVNEHLRQTRNNPRSLSPRNEKIPPKNLRFFGDTDVESNASISKAGKYNKSRKPFPSPASNLSQNQKKFSQSAYDLDNISDQRPQQEHRYRSSSLQNLDEKDERTFRTKKSRNISRSRELHDISESLSASDTDLNDNRRRDVSPGMLNGYTNTSATAGLAKFKQKTNAMERNVAKKGNNTLQQQYSNEHHRLLMTHDVDDTDMTFEQKRHLFDENRHAHSPSRENSQERSSLSPLRKNYEISLSPNGDTNKPPLGPQKPARAFERRRAFSRERDRIHDSSGTEGDSSQQSQRSVVYLHATTVGEIPTSYAARSISTAKAVSREDLSAKPMTRTVSRSISVLAPWKPKHLSEGYEINYSRDDQRAKNVTPTRQTHDYNSRRTQTSVSNPVVATKLRKDKKSTTLMRSKSSLNKDDRLSEQSSSFNSTSNRNYRNARNTDSLPRRKY